ALVRWGMIYGAENEQGFHHQDDWDLVALKALFHPEYARGLSVCVQFETEDFSGWMAVENQHVDMGLGEAPEADITVNGTIKDLFTTAASLDELCASGSKQKLKQFKSAFVLRL
ncbi:MAG: hypothetical protein ACE5KS_05585, partial [Woeseiaceae bacterium]